MSTHSRTRRTRAATPATDDPAEAARESAHRERQLAEFATTLLPADVSSQIDLTVSKHLPTACVFPASREALDRDPDAPLEDKQLQSLVEGTDADYLIAVSARERSAPQLDFDQPTLDYIVQHGFTLHEVLHVLKTASGAVADLFDDHIAPEHREYVDQLFNTVEDGAIEYEARNGDFSDRASRYLAVSRVATVQTPADYAEQHGGPVSLLKGVEYALYDLLIHDTGKYRALMDPTDDRLEFPSAPACRAFRQIQRELAAFAARIRTHDSRGDGLHEHDKSASIGRANEVLDFWQTTLKPLIETADDESAGASQSGSGGPDNSGQSSNQSGEAESQSAQDQDSGVDAPSEGQSPPPELSPDDVAPDDESADSEQDLSSRPSIIPADDSPTDPDQSDDEADPSEADQPENAPESDSDVEPGSDSEPTDDAGEASDATGQTEQSAPQSSPEADADAAPEQTPEDTPTGQSGGDDTSTDPTDDRPSEAEPEQAPDGPDAGETSTETPEETGGESPSGSGAGPDTSPTEQEPGDSDSPEDTPEGDSSAETDGQTDDDPSGDEQMTLGQFGGGNSSSESGPEDSDEAGSGGSQHAESDAETDDTDGTDQSSSGGTPDASDGSDTSADDSEAGQSPSGSDADTPSGDATDPGSSPDSGSDPDSEFDSGSDHGSDSDSDTDSDSDSDSNSEGRSDSDATAGDDGDVTDGEDTESEESEGHGIEESDDHGQGESEGHGSDGSDDHGTEESDNHESDGSDELPDLESAMEALEGALEALAEMMDLPAREAQATIDEVSIDGDGLRDELDALDDQLGGDPAGSSAGDDESSQSDTRGPDRKAEQGGDGAVPDSVTELPVLPRSETDDFADSWDDVEEDAEYVADTLRKELELQAGGKTIRNRTAGSFDTKMAHRAAYGDPRQFNRTLSGDTPDHVLICVLDRSTSMGHFRDDIDGEIVDATKAVARFVAAAERLDIPTCVVDLYNDEARLAKPMSIRAVDAQEQLLATDTGGGTPLGDALDLATDIAEANRKDPFIITMTDGRPADPEKVIDVIEENRVPVCSLRIDDATPTGELTETQERLDAAYWDSEEVTDSDALLDTIDRLAAGLGYL